MQGLVYDCFEEDLNTAALFDFPSGTQFFGGIDWGYTDPFVLVIHAVLPNGLRFQVSETYQTGMTLPEILELCIQKKKTWNVLRFYADPSQPGSIEYLSRNGCTCLPADNDLRLGIDTMYEQIKSRNFKLIHGTSPNTIDQMDTYHYPDPKDLKPNQNSQEAKPVGQNDHACDAIRYLIVMTARSNVKYIPKVAGPKSIRTEQQKISNLLKKSKNMSR